MCMYYSFLDVFFLHSEFHNLLIFLSPVGGLEALNLEAHWKFLGTLWT